MFVYLGNNDTVVIIVLENLKRIGQMDWDDEGKKKKKKTESGRLLSL